MSAPWMHGDPRDVARSIVADPRYHRQAASQPSQASWFDIVSGWIAQALRALLHGVDRALGSRNLFEAAIGFAVVAVALGLLGFGCYVLVRSFLRGARGRSPRARGVPGASCEETSRELWAGALAAARGGRYRAATALLFLSAVRALDERGSVAYDPARTPGEYRRLVRDPFFDVLASDAVIALFAAGEPPSELFERMRSAYERYFGAPG